MPPKVSVLLGSCRPGGVDMMLRGLAHQTFQDFEIVFADRRYAQRHELVLDFAREIGLRQPLYHVPNHRSDPTWRTTCAGFNTEFMLAAGEIGIMHLDYAYAPPEWIEAHLAQGRRFVMAPVDSYVLPALVYRGDEPLLEFSSGGANTSVEAIAHQFSRFDREISVFAQRFDPSMFASPIGRNPAIPGGPAHFNYMNTKNCSFPIATMLDINGIDENADRGGGPGDTDLGRRLCQAGLESWMAPEAYLRAFNTRSVLPTSLLGLRPDERPPGGRWSGVDGGRYFEQRWSSGVVRANNFYSLRERREQIWNWRELSQERAAVIPDNVVSDETYWPNFGWIP